MREETRRLLSKWSPHPGESGDSDLESLLGAKRLADVDLFDRVQLAEVARVCRESRSLSEAGRLLFAASRRLKKAPNDADRLRKYLLRFGLDWEGLRARSL